MQLGGVTMIIDAMKLRLALVRQCKGNKDFALEAGLCEGTITKLCKTDSRVRNSTVGKISKTLGVNPLEIIKA